MRALTDVETQTLFTKLANYTGRSLTQLIAPSDSSDDDNDRHVFRLHESRVYYVRLSLANLATAVARDNLLSLGTCVGKFTKTGKFRLHITALDVIAPHARYKLWIKPNGEMPFLYGGNVVKAHVGRWSEDCPEHSGVVILAMDDTPLGFGVTARSTAEARKLEPTTVVAFRQGDVGEYLREEDSGKKLPDAHISMRQILADHFIWPRCRRDKQVTTPNVRPDPSAEWDVLRPGQSVGSTSFDTSFPGYVFHLDSTLTAWLSNFA
ncbi:ribosome biosynthesis protein nip7 [Exophiala xenobiotica]|uniref:Ribosome biosynthesis protein nip7 n=1 Tax=Vermiconidia calcicola TaxID=1690605 RepID=A0AAV9QLF8_9PEZI|nr:ribosome biosynthesis protein nip7 [Exophiala xenobiotica]KAK5543508.1 ribosome biosynthesis protein nip7 [Vermiconidia calcicola]KAK5297786.1 ribosome biosynthesis protein nip7 [Exophiala xenobiotica]KAK5337831.1 ribosome biosynthesis protein nip7 [Exophiala xenobiotica]KAK5426002.1 ribosome biosynthesis protein nip7 [Exophiala xenobiotica]